MDIPITILGYNFTVSMGLEIVVPFGLGGLLMFVFDRWVLGRKVRSKLAAAETRIAAQDTRLSVVERLSRTEESQQVPPENRPMPDSEEKPAIDEPDSRRAQELWRASPGAGYLAAKLIMKAPTLEEVRETYSAFRAATQMKEPALANWAFLYRLEEAGHGEEVYGWAFDLAGENEETMVDEETQVELMRWREQGRG